MTVSKYLLIAGVLGASPAFAAPAESPPPFLLQWGSWGVGPGQFRYPYGIATDSHGDVYVADNWNDRVQKFSSDGRFIRQWGGFGHGPGQFDSPTGLAISADDLIHVCDSQNGRVQVFDSNGAFIRSFFVGVGFEGVAVDDHGDIYLALTPGNKVGKYTRDGVLITEWGSYGADPGKFAEPFGIVADHSGHVYVGDIGNGRIQKFTSDGTFVDAWHVGSFYLAVDDADNIYVTYGNTVNIYS